MTMHQTAEEMEAALGASLKALRLDQNVDQQTVAKQAGISIGALKNLENGRGSTVRSLVSALRALGRAGWLTTIAPLASINPLTQTESATPRQRAATGRSARG
ncbi:MAG TPA: helix-turn-helix transcriptional regulator [Steroidobacteraceae bacterium]|nr:helix-turn-helix transcriptional regulator [Steroidobacteraceae bacterium]